MRLNQTARPGRIEAGGDEAFGRRRLLSERRTAQPRVEDQEDSLVGPQREHVGRDGSSRLVWKEECIHAATDFISIVLDASNIHPELAENWNILPPP